MKQWLTKKITRGKLDAFIAEHATKKRTLDIGCSNSPYAKLFPNRVGVDINDGPSVDIVADAHELPFKDGEFEVILCTEVLEHLHAPQKAIDEMYRVLKRGGKLVLTTRFIFPLHDTPHDYYRYTKYGLQYLFRGWKIEELKEEVGTMQTVGVLLQRIGYQTEMIWGVVMRAVFYLGAKLFLVSDKIIKKQYGAFIHEENNYEKNIMTSGYYLVCRK